MKSFIKILPVVVLALLSACTAFHHEPAYTPQRGGVVPGETINLSKDQNVYAVAQEHGVSMTDIIVLNNLHAPFTLKSGQSLVLPYKKGDPLSGSVPVEALTPAPLGGVQSEPLSPISSQSLPPVTQAPVGKNTLGSTVPSAPLEALTTPTSSMTPKQVATTFLSPKTAAVAPASVASAPSMIWPVKGPVVSAFGPKGQGVNNDGVNISAPKGAPIVAAAAGNVVYAGNEMKGFGNLVLIRHEDGWVTAYAYLDRVLVAKDAIVAQGDMIGTVGKTGNIATPQLHFETRHDGHAIDPNGVVKG